MEYIDIINELDELNLNKNLLRHGQKPVKEPWPMRHGSRSWKSRKSIRQWSKHKPGVGNLETLHEPTRFEYPRGYVQTITQVGSDFYQGDRKIVEGDLIFSPCQPDLGVYKAVIRNGELRALRNYCLLNQEQVISLKLVTDESINWEDWQFYEEGGIELGMYWWGNDPKLHAPKY